MVSDTPFYVEDSHGIWSTSTLRDDKGCSILEDTTSTLYGVQLLRLSIDETRHNRRAVLRCTGLMINPNTGELMRVHHEENFFARGPPDTPLYIAVARLCNLERALESRYAEISQVSRRAA